PRIPIWAGDFGFCTCFLENRATLTLGTMCFIPHRRRGVVLWAASFVVSLASAYPQSASELETLRVASSLFRSDNPDAAILALREHLNSHPEDAAVRMELARDLSFAKRFRESEQQYSILLQQDPANLHARVGVAKIASWQGDWDLALERYD